MTCTVVSFKLVLNLGRWEQAGVSLMFAFACSNDESLAGEEGNRGDPDINNEVLATTDQVTETPAGTLHIVQRDYICKLLVA